MFEWGESLDLGARWLMVRSPLPIRIGLFALLGALVGACTHGWVDQLDRRYRALLNNLGEMHSTATLDETSCTTFGHRLHSICALASLFAGLAFALTHLQSQHVPETGATDRLHVRLLFQLLLVSLLWVATLIDLRLYVIPDEITLRGGLLGLIIATVSGYLHPVPIWVDWNSPLVPVYGPYIPDWVNTHPHWHGFAFSVTGALAGIGLTWLVRILSALVLGTESLGFGDVTLMGMIGCYVGWQPILFVLLLAPLCSLVVAWGLSIGSGRLLLPYGPSLAAATLAVLVGWKWMWTPVRYEFGHWPTLLALVAGAFTGLVALLALLRLYRLIPTRPPANG